MSRLIEVDSLTKRLIEFCNKNCPYTAKARDIMCGSCFMGLALEAVEDAPTIDSEQRWISCKERLPEEAYPVIVTWKNDDPASYYQYILGKHYAGVAHYKNGKWFWYSSVTEDVLMEYGRCDSEEFDEAIKVLAWMPLPDPWKEGEK